MSKSAAKTETKQEAKPAAAEEKSVAALSKAQTTAVGKLATVSARIRYLDSEGFSRSDITKLIPNASGGQLRYQHVRNVLITPVGKAK
ncbi:hypothetical protein LCGC14_2301800 [marine sediment metagenome]|uniref:Uncharacterized protein n=1 Tax=marine sediment metagenome TaxID=412755 RepID=A0A0F9DAS8_9ZZZZ